MNGYSGVCAQTKMSVLANGQQHNSTEIQTISGPVMAMVIIQLPFNVEPSSLTRVSCLLFQTLLLIHKPLLTTEVLQISF